MQPTSYGTGKTAGCGSGKPVARKVRAMPKATKLASHAIINKDSAPHPGLPNLGNTCYLSCVLQVLFFCPNFRSYLVSLHKRRKKDISTVEPPAKRRRFSATESSEAPLSLLNINLENIVAHHTILGRLVHVFNELDIESSRRRTKSLLQQTGRIGYKRHAKSTVDLTPLLRSVGEVNGQFLDPSKQQDVQEFLCFLLGSLHDLETHYNRLEDHDKDIKAASRRKGKKDPNADERDETESERDVEEEDENEIVVEEKEDKIEVHEKEDGKEKKDKGEHKESEGEVKKITVNEKPNESEKYDDVKLQSENSDKADEEKKDGELEIDIEPQGRIRGRVRGGGQMRGKASAQTRSKTKQDLRETEASKPDEEKSEKRAEEAETLKKRGVVPEKEEEENKSDEDKITTVVQRDRGRQRRRGGRSYRGGREKKSPVKRAGTPRKLIDLTMMDDKSKMDKPGDADSNAESDATNFVPAKNSRPPLDPALFVSEEEDSEDSGPISFSSSQSSDSDSPLPVSSSPLSTPSFTTPLSPTPDLFFSLNSLTQSLTAITSSLTSIFSPFKLQQATSGSTTPTDSTRTTPTKRKREDTDDESQQAEKKRRKSEESQYTKEFERETRKRNLELFFNQVKNRNEQKSEDKGTTRDEPLEEREFKETRAKPIQEESVATEKQKEKEELTKIVTNKRERRTLVEKLFKGSLVSTITCLSCSYVSRREENFNDLSLTILKNQSLLWSLGQFVATERLQGQNKYNCGNCGRMSDATRELNFESLPPVLTIHLKRFSYTETKRKVSDHVECPMELDLDEFSCDGVKGSTKYQLFAVILHKGSYGSGHYTTLLRPPPELLSDVDPAQPPNVYTRQRYICQTTTNTNPKLEKNVKRKSLETSEPIPDSDLDTEESLHPKHAPDSALTTNMTEPATSTTPVADITNKVKTTATPETKPKKRRKRSSGGRTYPWKPKKRKKPDAKKKQEEKLVEEDSSQPKEEKAETRKAKSEEKESKSEGKRSRLFGKDEEADKSWMYIDDEKVYYMSVEKVKSYISPNSKSPHTAYILFYSQVP